jgi:hypothetical protein
LKNLIEEMNAKAQQDDERIVGWTGLNRIQKDKQTAMDYINTQTGE